MCIHLVETYLYVQITVVCIVYTKCRDLVPMVSIQKYIILDDSGINKPENMFILGRKFEFADLFWTNACKGPLPPQCTLQILLGPNNAG